jgi:hypothetical protein
VLQEGAGRGSPLSSLALLTRRAAQRSVKFIRRLRQALRERLAEALTVARLKALYAALWVLHLNTQAIHWMSVVSGQIGAGTKLFEQKEAERLAA